MKIAASAFKAARRWAQSWSPVPGAYARRRIFHHSYILRELHR